LNNESKSIKSTGKNPTMRIALLQINLKTADPEANGCLIEAAYIEAVKFGAELVVTTVLVLVGYLTDDRLLKSDLCQRIISESKRLSAICGSVPLILGTCSLAPSGKLWNELWWCESGKVCNVIHKRIFSMHNTFNENRYFEQDANEQPLICFKNERIGLAIYDDCCPEA
jgi:predicted amidohydrolase